jgi:hypothetical protein
MENTRISKYTISFGISLAFASVVNGLLVVAKEKIPAVLSGMQKLTGHHWVTHGIIVIGIFAFFGWLLGQLNGGQGLKLNVNRLIGILLAGVVTGGLLIVGFYLIGD